MSRETVVALLPLRGAFEEAASIFLQLKRQKEYGKIQKKGRGFGHNGGIDMAKDKDAFAGYFAYIREHTDQEALQKMAADSIQEYLQEEGRKLGKLPENAVIGHLCKCSVNIQLAKNGAIRVSLEIGIQYGGQGKPFSKKLEEPTPSLKSPFLGDLQKFDHLLYQSERNAIQSMLAKLKSSIIVCQETSMNANQISQKLWSDFSFQRNSFLGQYCDSRWSQGKEGKLVSFLGEHRYEICKHAFQRGQGVAFSDEDLSPKPESLMKILDKQSSPHHKRSFRSFCESASTLYAQFQEEHPKRMPELTFIFEDGQIRRCIWEGHCLNVEMSFMPDVAYQTTLRTRVLNVFCSVLGEIEKEYEIVGEQIKALEALNPLEYQILERICENGRTWFSDMCAINSMVSKDFIQNYLDHLCRVTVPCAQGETVLLEANYRKGNYGYFYVYRFSKGVLIQTEDLHIINPRPFSERELAHLTKKGLETVFWESLRLASTPDLRWQTFCLLEKLPKTFTAGFVKSEEGQKFLEQFEGDDAVYAAFFVQSLPGCKQIAKKYFPDEII